MMRSDVIALHDRKPRIQIHDYTFYYFLTASMVVFVLMLLVIYLLIRRLREERGRNLRRECYDAISALNLDDTKTAAYAITRLGRCFADDSARLREAYDNLSRRLEPYKFKKAVPAIDEETRGYYRIFLGMIDV